MHASMFCLSTHTIFFMRDMSTDTIILFSVGDRSKACDTLVPPPYGMSATSCLTASFTSVYKIHDCQYDICCLPRSPRGCQDILQHLQSDRKCRVSRRKSHSRPLRGNARFSPICQMICGNSNAPAPSPARNYGCS